MLAEEGFGVGRPTQKKKIAMRKNDQVPDYPNCSLVTAVVILVVTVPLEGISELSP